MRVLVVDDELDTAETIAFLLKDAGHHVDFAVTAKAALEMAGREKPDVVVLDLGLPDMDGLELARRLKSSSGVRAPRVIAITGRMAEAEPAALAAGCDRFLQKPVDPSQLDALIRNE